MKKYFIFTLILIFISISLFAENETKVPIKRIEHSTGLAPFSQVRIRHEEPATFSRQETAYGNDVSANNWYSFDTGTMGATTIAPVTYSCFAGDYGIQGFFAIDYNTDNLLQIDPDTGAETIIGNMPCPLAGSGGIWSDLFCDKTTGNWYATAVDLIVNSQLYSVDITNASITWVADLISTGTISAAVDQNGLLYTLCIVTDSTYETDLSTYITTLLGPAGFDANYAQGAAYEPVDDIFYFAAYGVSAELRTLDRVTGMTTYVGALPGETGAFGFPGSLAEPGAPAAPTDVFVIPDAGGALEVDIDWTCPTLQVNGDPLNDLDEMRVYRGDILIYTDSAPVIGGPGSYMDVSVPLAGEYTYNVVGYNDFGEGIPASGTTWVGEDVPDAVTDLTLTDVSTDDLMAQLDWVNPTTGLHGGYFPGVTGYDIERSDAATFTIGGPVTQWIDDTIVDPGIYWYTVTPFNNSGPGPSTTSAQVGIGVSIIQVGNQESTDYQIPMNIWYDNSIVECVYDMEWIGTDMLVNAIGFHASIASTVPAFNLEIWLGEVDINNLSGGFLNNSQLTMVYDGTIDVPVGDSWVELTLDTPFEYTYSENLVMGVVKDDDEYYSTSDTWWCTESGTASRSIHQYSDTIEYTIQSPPTTTLTKTTYPDVRFYYSELAHGDVDGVITNNVTANPIEGVEVFVGNWGPATTNTLGEYLIEDIVTGIQPVTATKEGYYDFFGSVEVLADVVVTYDIGMDPNLFGALDGTVTDADTGDPLVGAEINAVSAGGYEYDTVTNATGYYSIVDVVAETYDVFCSFPNYPTEVVEDVIIVDGQTTTIDFELEGYAYWNDFETNDGGLISDNPNGWQWGAFTSGPMAGYSGTNGWATLIGGDYPTNSNFTLDTPVPFFVESPLAMLEFWHWYDIEASYDGGNVKVSTDGGTSWTVITSLTGYTGTANTSNPLSGEPIFCGHDQGYWEFEQFDLSAYQGQSIIIRWHFGSDGSVQYPGWYIDDVSVSGCSVPNQGSLEGTVTEFGTGTPIEGAVVTVGAGLSGTTLADGTYEITAIWPGDYDITCEAPLYLPAEELGFTIAEGVNTLDFSLLWSEIAVDVTELSCFLPPDTTAIQTFTITNDGPGDLEYNISFDFPAEVRVRNTSRNNSTPSRNNSTPSRVNDNTSKQSIIWETNTLSEDRDPNASYSHGTPQIDDPGDIIFEIDVQALSGDDQCLGTEYVAPYLWVTGGGGTSGTVENSLYKIDPVAGTLEATYLQNTTSAWGMRDLCYDPVAGLLYAGDDNGFYSIDPADGTVTTVFTGAIGACIRALAYDGTHFWTKSFSDPLYEFDIAGNIINSYTDALSTYGMAYDSFEDCLWLFATPTTFFQYDLNGASTGITYGLVLPNAGIVGGAFYDEGGLVPGLTVLGCLGQGTPDVVYAMELRDAEIWVSITNNISGTVPGNGGSIVVEVTFDSAELLIGDVLTADLLIHNNANYVATRGDDYVIPVTLTVTGFIPPSNLYVDLATWLFTWDAPPGPNLLGYNVFLDDMINEIGTTTSIEWQYEDLVAGQAYVAGVSAVYDDGESIVMEYPFTPVDAGDIIPLVTELRGNFPNPFNPDTQIAFSINKQSHVQITIYNIRGQKVRTLVDEQRDANNYTVTWNGTDNNRKPVSSGIYFYKMKAEKYVSTKKMILMK